MRKVSIVYLSSEGITIANTDYGDWHGFGPSLALMMANQFTSDVPTVPME